MTATALYSHFGEALGISASAAREWFRELERLAVRELKKSGEFVIPGMVTLVVQKRKARQGRNPATGEVISIRTTTVVKGRVAKPLTDGAAPAREDVGRIPSVESLQRPPSRSAKAAGAPAPPMRRRHAPGPDMKPAAVDHNAEIVRVFFGTDRKAASTMGKYGADRAKAFSLGWCDVSIPRDHRLAVIERPSWRRLEFREYRDRHFVIVERYVEPEPERFWSTLRSLTEAGARQALVFIHGFNVSFDDGVYRTAQLSYDLKFDGLTLLYSWASNGRAVRYSADIENNGKTVQALKRFLLAVASRSGIDDIHVIAHSMGNRALVDALYQLAIGADRQETKIRNLILTAPDIDADTFSEIAGEMARTAKKTTLYASSNDKALRLSKLKAKYPRVGDATEMVVVEGIDSIDASRLETDFTGHSYYGDQTSVLSDIFEIVHRGTPPAKRIGLHGVPRTGPKYWRFVPTR